MILPGAILPYTIAKRALPPEGPRYGQPLAVTVTRSAHIESEHLVDVAVVDGDIDPWNARQVEWAVATRMRPERDLIVVPGVQADRSEPLEQGGTVGKLGIDATIHAADRADWTLAQAPAAVRERVRAKLRGA